MLCAIVFVLSGMTFAAETRALLYSSRTHLGPDCALQYVAEIVKTVRAKKRKNGLNAFGLWK